MTERPYYLADVDTFMKARLDGAASSAPLVLREIASRSGAVDALARQAETLNALLEVAANKAKDDTRRLPNVVALADVARKATLSLLALR